MKTASESRPLRGTVRKMQREVIMQPGWIYFALLIAVLLLLFFAFYPQIERFFVFYPQAHLDAHPTQWRLAHEEVYFGTEDGERLHGWFFPLKGEAPVLLFCHGNAGNISHRLENVKFLLDQELQVFIFDYRGYGKSTGRPSEMGLYRDGLAAYDLLVNSKHISPDRIIPFGRSLGAAVAVEVSLKRDVRSLILESAFTSTKEMANTIFPFKLLSIVLPPHFNNLEKLAQTNPPKLIIHGEEDDIVPFSMGQKLYHTARPPKYFFPIKGAAHNDTYVVGGERYFQTLVSFAKDSRI